MTPSVDELSWDLLQFAERLLKLEALGAGRLLSIQNLRLQGGGRRLATLAQGVGRHDEEFLHDRSFWLLLLLGTISRGAAVRLRAADAAGCFGVLDWGDLLRSLEPGVLQTLLCCGPIPEGPHTHTHTDKVSVTGLWRGQRCGVTYWGRLQSSIWMKDRASGSSCCSSSSW